MSIILKGYFWLVLGSYCWSGLHFRDRGSHWVGEVYNIAIANPLLFIVLVGMFIVGGSLMKSSEQAAKKVPY